MGNTASACCQRHQEIGNLDLGEANYYGDNRDSAEDLEVSE